MQPSSKAPTLVSLFSGAGGLDLGFEQAGFRTLWANEYDRTIAPSYQHNFPHVAFDGRSIRDVPSDDVPEAIGLIGGPPCQSWSEAGARRGIEDPRGELFFEYIRILRRVKPHFFVAENVHGLVHSRNMASFQNILKLFEAEGFNVSWRLLTASDYGVAQDRQRVFIVGYRRELGVNFEFPEPHEQRVNLRDAIGDLANVPFGTDSPVANHELHESGYSSIFLSRNRVRGWDESSFTILATDRHIPFHPQAPKMIAQNGGGKMLVPGAEHLYRRLTVRECARIQAFPDAYRFLYSHPRTGYKMVGNAVPVGLAKAVAARIYADMEIVQRGPSKAKRERIRVGSGAGDQSAHEGDDRRKRIRPNQSACA